MKKKILFSIFSLTLALILAGCNSKSMIDVDLDVLQNKIYNGHKVKTDNLDQSVTLYLDHSTCVIDANLNSPVFKSLKPQLGLYADTLCLIKGSEFEVVPNTDKSANSTAVFNIINGISADIPHADIGTALKKICHGNSQAVLITDCEYFDENGMSQDGNPYLSGEFKTWVSRGHEIYIISEPYKEKNRGKIYNKKRFYFIFTEDNMKAPVSDNLINQIERYLQDSTCTMYKISNTDIHVQLKGNMFSNDLDVSDVTQGNDFSYAELDDDWNTIREYVMKLDEYGEPLENDEGTGKSRPVPLIQNLCINEGANYSISDVEIEATNISSQYVALDDKTVTPNTDNVIKDGFSVDKKALERGVLNVYVTDKIFDYLTDDYGGNLIRLDFVVTQTRTKPFCEDMFKWSSICTHSDAICVSQSIENVLNDVDINLATAENRKIIYTVFLNTQSYKTK